MPQPKIKIKSPVDTVSKPCFMEVSAGSNAMNIKSCEYWDGNASMPVVLDDGGREMAGFKGRAGDCVTRAITIASEMQYREVYDILAAGNEDQRKTKRGGKRTASRGINTTRKWFKDQMIAWGFRWTPTMLIGSGCKVHLLKGELPAGRLVVALSKHYTAVIDGIVHDTYDPHRSGLSTVDGVTSLSHRCVYGFWQFNR